MCKKSTGTEQECNNSKVVPLICTIYLNKMMKTRNFNLPTSIKRMLLLVVVVAIGSQARAQWKSFKVSDKGDTLNIIDKKGLKQGAWVETTQPLRGNPGYEEEGVYKNDKREGLWRRYNLQGDVLAMENYKWGLLNGKCQYFTLDGMEREENWKALDPDKEYDTLDVPDLYIPDVYKKVVVKNEGYAMKHGKWTFYDPRTGFIQKTESYYRDSLENPMKAFGFNKKQPIDDSTKLAWKKKALLVKTPEIKEYEKKNAGKKKVAVRDGSTGL